MIWQQANNLVIHTDTHTQLNCRAGPHACRGVIFELDRKGSWQMKWFGSKQTIWSFTQTHTHTHTHRSTISLCACLCTLSVSAGDAWWECLKERQRQTASKQFGHTHIHTHTHTVNSMYSDTHTHARWQTIYSRTKNAQSRRWASSGKSKEFKETNAI